jgi:hypothetical protein
LACLCGWPLISPAETSLAHGRKTRHPCGPSALSALLGHGFHQSTHVFDAGEVRAVPRQPRSRKRRFWARGSSTPATTGCNEPPIP